MGGAIKRAPQVERVAVIGDFSASRREGLGLPFCHCTLAPGAGTKRSRQGLLSRQGDDWNSSLCVSLNIVWALKRHS